jgi:hypothetical protein
MNHKTTIMHKATITQDIRGSPPAWGYVHQLFIFFIIFVNHLHAQSHKVLLHIGQEICAHLARSSFPELGYNTKPLHNLLQSLALSLASLTQYAQSMYNYHLHLAHWHHTDALYCLLLHRLDIYLYITKWA